MEAQPQPPTPTTAPPLSSVTPPSQHLNYPDSVDSSPRSRNTDSWDEPFPPASSKLRLMCSYGGHIVPRPHDKSLCYVGGDTRIVVVERTTSLNDLSTRLAKTFLNGRTFTLKYQLPNEDLDSLISVTTDEDLENMIDEYDRTTAANSSLKPSRIRLFLFPTKPESTHSIPPQILDTSSAKSDDWFLDALNGAGLLNRGFSDSASVNCLLGLDDDVAGNNIEPGSRDVPEGVSQPGSFGNGKNLKQDVHSVPDSPMMETTSSFGSTSSSPSLANLPPIRVHVEDGAAAGGVRVQQQQQQPQQQDQKVLGIEEQFAQMGVGVGQKLQDEGFAVLSSPPPPPVPTTLSAAVVGVPIGAAVVAGEYQNRVFSDDERSDQGMPVVYRKPPTPQLQTQPQSQPQAQSQLAPQFQQKSSGGVDLPSPDSVSSDSSLSNAMSRPKPVIYQEQVQIQPVTTRVPSNAVDPKLNVTDLHGRIQVQQHVQDQGYLLQQQFDQQQQLQHQHQQQKLQQQQHQQHQQQQQHQQHQQQQQHQQHQQQQFIGGHFVHHNPGIPQYYPVYPSQQQPQVYYVPASQAQAYNLAVQQANMGESAAAAIPSSRPQNPPNPAATLVQPTAAYNPIRNAPLPKTEMTAAAYRTATAGNPQFVQVPTSQHQQQYVTYSQIHHPSQSMAPNSAAPANYAYEYTDPAHAQIYYSQPMAPTMPSQYQTMTAAGMVMPEASAQHPSDGMKQQIRTSQPL